MGDQHASPVNSRPIRFAYVASHDLSEPLRAISGPISLLARRYPDQIDAEADQFIEFAVDNGIGIEARHRDRIFGMFKRLHSRAEYEGSGIALALCKRIVERQGGRIGVEAAQSGQGSSFWFALPIGAAPVAAAPVAAPVASGEGSTNLPDLRPGSLAGRDRSLV